MAEKKRIVVITDGDEIARAAVEEAARNVGGRAISATAGNPTRIPPEKAIELIKSSEGDPILVMVDDKGKCGQGPGESLLRMLSEEPGIDLLGVVAVASNTCGVKAAEVDFSVNRNKQVIEAAVDKNGYQSDGKKLKGDTVEVLNGIDLPVVVGLGDPGKMEEADLVSNGAPVLTEAIRQILAKVRS